MHSRRQPGFGFIGNLGSGNLGDEASLQSVLQQIRQRCPNAYICVFSGNPADSRARYGIEAFPSRKEIQEKDVDITNLVTTRTLDEVLQSGTFFSTNHSQSNGSDTQYSGLKPDQTSQKVNCSFASVRKTKPHDELSPSAIKMVLLHIPILYAFARFVVNMPVYLIEVFKEIRFIIKIIRQLKKVDVLIAAGGGQFADNFTGPFGYPYYHMRWVLISRLLGKKILYVSVGAMPMKSWLSRLFSRIALNLSNYHSFRDHTTLNILTSYGVKPGPVTADLAFALNSTALLTEKPNLGKKQKKTTIGINLFPHGDDRYWPDEIPGMYPRYLEIMSEFSAWLIQQNINLVFFPTQIRSDSLVIKDVLDILGRQFSPEYLDRQVKVAELRNLDELMNCLRSVDMVVCTRFHGILLSFLAGKPVLGLSNQTKMVDLMRNTGQGEYQLDLDEMTIIQLKNTFTNLESASTDVYREIVSRVKNYRRDLDNQFDSIFSRIINS